MPWTELAAPSALAVNLEDLKGNLRLTSNDEDGLLTFYAHAVTDHFERVTSQRLISRSFRVDEPDFPAWGGGIELPIGPASAITHIKYYDTGGTLTTWDASNYVLDTSSHFPRVLLAPDKTFPTVQSGRHDGVQVTFTAGYGATYASVPKGIQWAVIVLASHCFTNRLPPEKVPEGLQAVIAPYKLRRA